MTRVTAAAALGLPVHPVMPLNVVDVVLVYEQTPFPPATENNPLESKPVVDATVRLPVARSWLAPLTVVAVVMVTVTLSSGMPVVQPVNEKSVASVTV